MGESTVRRYAAEARRRMDVPLAEVMVPQHHPLGEEAEVDFGSASVYLAGVLVEVSMFIVRLSASGRGYARAYLNEAQEVFLDGHIRAFEHFGAVAPQHPHRNVPRNIFRNHHPEHAVEEPPGGLAPLDHVDQPWLCVSHTKQRRL